MPNRQPLVAVLALLMLLPSGLPATAQAQPAVAPGGDCGALLNFDFTQYPDAPTTLSVAEVVPAGGELPEYCRVVGSVGPGAVNFEMRLPTQTWNGRLLTQGSGGSGGAVNIDDCEDVLARDYVTVATDMGHANTDECWTKDFQQLLDFSFRAVHVTTATAKALTEADYGQAQNYAYFRGCSSGGRAAMVSAQRFPGDFDGIIAGAVGTPRAKSYFIPTWIIQSNIGPDGKAITTQAELPKVSHAVLEACGSGEAKELGWLTAIENWVEKGEAPKTVTGQKFNDDGQLAFEWPVTAFVPRQLIVPARTPWGCGVAMSPRLSARILVLGA